MRSPPAPLAGEETATSPPTEEAGSVELDRLYRSQRSALVRFFTRHRATPDDASDLVQDAFLRLSRLAPPAGEIARPEAYLHRIARNLLRDRAKAARRHSDDLHVPLDDVAIMDIDQQRRLEARDSLARIEAAMVRMKPKTREIFMAHRVHGLSYTEIAAATGLTVKGVEKQMGKAIAQLARLMDRS